jgi:hypothetical protein
MLGRNLLFVNKIILRKTMAVSLVAVLGMALKIFNRTGSNYDTSSSIIAKAD